VIPVTVAEAAKVLGVEPTGGSGVSLDPAVLTPGGTTPPRPPGANVTLASLTADSRTVTKGSLFVALPGERVDGHEFVPAAREHGAVAVLVARRVDSGLSLVVPDPLVAFGQLARDQVDRGRAGGLRVLAVTGSVGKTSTKDLLAQLLESGGPTIAPAGNLNNELGLPLTIARIDGRTRFLVAEMGARGIGHIAYLCRIAPPDVAVVLNVGVAHVGEFGDKAQIAVAKSELVEALPSTGVAVLNADDPLVWQMRSRTAAPVIAFGVGDEPASDRACWASDLVSDQLGRYGFTLHHRLDTESEDKVEIQLQLSGRHQVGNAVAAAAAARAVGVPLDAVASSLRTARSRSRWRMELRTRPDGALVVNDAYNANPESMRAALDTLAELGRGRRGGRTWAILGEMLELGEHAAAEHEALGRYLARSGIDRLVALGREAATVVGAARTAGLGGHAAVVAADKAEAAAIVLAGLAPADVVLVKASRGLALDTVAEQILHQDRP
jgi:UDP-N-acetylmuramoyl-tripeptide--D-alanyl-D-alanine ligase